MALSRSRTSCAVTQPDAAPITFSEARLFLQNAGGRLSAQEAQNLPPVGRKYLTEFASSLDDAIGSTADDAGVLDDYSSAVDEYRKAMRLNDAWEATKDLGIKILKYSIPGATTAYAIKSAYSR